MPADSAKVADVEALVKEVMETTDHVDILFANAGATWGEKFDTHPDGAFAKVMDLNVKSVFNTIRLYVLFFHADGWAVSTSITTDAAGNRFAALLQKNATMEDPSRVIVTASIAGLGVGSLGENATFGYSASKGMPAFSNQHCLSLMFFPLYSGCNSSYPESGCRARPSTHPLQQHCPRFLPLEDGFGIDVIAWW